MLSSLDFAYAHMCMYVVSHASHSREKVSLLTLSSEAGEKVDETTLQHKMAVCYTATTHAEVQCQDSSTHLPLCQLDTPYLCTY